jgi:hypothetical protein
VESFVTLSGQKGPRLSLLESLLSLPEDDLIVPVSRLVWLLQEEKVASFLLISVQDDGEPFPVPLQGQDRDAFDLPSRPRRIPDLFSQTEDVSFGTWPFVLNQELKQEIPALHEADAIGKLRVLGFL